MKLRKYQEDLFFEILLKLDTIDKLMVQAPMGYGKTHILATLTEYFIKQNQKVWILVHRKELIYQSLEKLSKLGIEASVIQSEFDFEHNNPVQVVSIQTAVRKLKTFKAPDIIICDEAHHSPAPTYKRIYDNFSKAKLIGLTATPIRTAGEGFDKIFQEMICGKTAEELIKMNYLSLPKIYSRPIKFNLDEIKVKRGDYENSELYKQMNKREIYGDFIQTYNKFAKNKQTIAFAVNIEHSKNIVKSFNDANISAVHIDGKTPNKIRDQIISDFRVGKYQVLSNVDLISEGFDVPDCECIILARPTKSLTKYLQMVGRGMRIADNKDFAIILDHSDCVKMHGFPQQNRKWSLKPRLKKQIEDQDKEIRGKDIETGMIYNLSEVPYNADVELIEVDFSQVRFEILYTLCQIQNGWKIFLEKFHIPYIPELEYFAKTCKKSNDWLNKQYQKYGYIEFT